MESVKVTITSSSEQSYGSVELEVPNVATALAVVNINSNQGSAAELRKGDNVLARIRKHGHGPSSYWEVDAN